MHLDVLLQFWECAWRRQEKGDTTSLFNHGRAARGRAAVRNPRVHGPPGSSTTMLSPLRPRFLRPILERVACRRFPMRHRAAGRGPGCWCLARPIFGWTCRRAQGLISSRREPATVAIQPAAVEVFQASTASERDRRIKGGCILPRRASLAMVVPESCG